MTYKTTLSRELHQYADYRATPNELSGLLYGAAERHEELVCALRNMLEEFDDATITDDIRTQIGMPSNTVKALQKARAALAKATS